MLGIRAKLRFERRNSQRHAFYSQTFDNNLPARLRLGGVLSQLVGCKQELISLTRDIKIRKDSVSSDLVCRKDDRFEEPSSSFSERKEKKNKKTKRNLQSPPLEKFLLFLFFSFSSPHPSPSLRQLSSSPCTVRRWASQLLNNSLFSLSLLFLRIYPPHFSPRNSIPLLLFLDSYRRYLYPAPHSRSPGLEGLAERCSYSPNSFFAILPIVQPAYYTDRYSRVATTADK